MKAKMRDMQSYISAVQNLKTMIRSAEYVL